VGPEVVTAYAAERWTEFGVATAGAAAALAGLLVVAVSINLERILQYPSLPNRAGHTLILFALPLVAALLLVVPGQPDAALGSELLVIGVVVGAFMLVTNARTPLTEQESRTTWVLSRLLPAVLSCGFLALTGITLIAESGGGLYWLVPAVLAAIVFGLINAWVLLIEILR
jgi:hypothetical protein